MNNKFFLSIILLSFFVSGCSSYISKIHQEIDRADGNTGPSPESKDKFDYLRKAQQYRQDEPKRMLEAQSLSSASQSYVDPRVKRVYKPMEVARKRYKADDLNDNDYDGSLWAGRGNENYLFTLNSEKKTGDIVQIDVYSKLKTEIALELKRAFPTPPPPKKKEAKEGEGEEGKAPASTPAPQAAQAQESDDENDKVYDHISSIIVEEINKDHLLLRGRKHLLYKNRKRLVEVQALVSRKDIQDNNSVNSNTILESSVKVLK